MKRGILVVTQVVDANDPVLGFFVGWLRELGSTGEPILTVCWRRGASLDLPKNVRVFVAPSGGLRRVVWLCTFSFAHRREVQSVFVHMIPPVIAAIGWWWRLLGWHIVLWYTHAQVTNALRVATLFSHEVLTATPGGFQIETKKKCVTGHGVDLSIYRSLNLSRGPLMLTVGRVTPVKQLELVIDLCLALRHRDPALSFRVAFIGEPRTGDDERYLKRLKERVRVAGLESIVSFLGAKTGESLIRLYSEAALLVSATKPGSLDKVVLEALACETPCLTIGEAYLGISGVYVASSAWEDGALQFADESLRYPQAHPEARKAVAEKADLRQLIQTIRQRLTI